MTVVRLGLEPSDEKLLQLQGGPLFHSDPRHASFAWLVENGFAVESLSEGPVPDGSILILVEEAANPLEELVTVVDRLLGPGGCPWDQEQTHESLKKYLLEEAYEVLDAIDSKDLSQLEEELGDLLLQPIMHAQMEKLAGGFDIQGVARKVVEKLVRRHPHVFGDVWAADADEVLRNWDALKKAEKPQESRSILSGVPKSMASLLRAHEVSKRAARTGFEWPDMDSVFEKLREEESELREAIASEDPAAVESEIGDLLFTAVNLARWAGVEPEEALRKMLNRFTARFMHMEASTSASLRSLSPEEWDMLWREAKTSVG